jgi:N-succinyldiaminopimelate aminotransferase
MLNNYREATDTPMNPSLERLHRYPFEKLADLKRGVKVTSGEPHIALSIGEPKHPAPDFVLSALTDNLDQINKYPATGGLPELRAAATRWASQRYQLSHLDPAQVLPVNGTREALFAIAQALVDNTKPRAKILMPNPFYQIYEGAGLLAGVEPVYINCQADNNLLPDLDTVDAATWADCQLLYVCTPGNPTGAVISPEYFRRLLALADEYNFVIVSDECYSEIYFDQPPAGLLEVCEQTGRTDYRNCIIMQSLSKRSNLPGLRSGFVAGDQAIITAFLRYRTYHGCAMSMPTQFASIAAWGDEQHVADNRALYREKFRQVYQCLNPVMPLTMPDAAFFFWAETPIDDCEFAQRLYAQEHITVLPGSYMAREADGINPGRNRIRLALVADVSECLQAAERIANFVKRL